MHFTKEALGRQLYLHRQPWKTDSVLITSHGGYRNSTRTLDLRELNHATSGSLIGVSVYFWARHGNTSSYKLVNGLASDAYDSFEQYLISDKPGERGKSIIVNYELSKFEDDTTKKILETMKMLNADKTAGLPIRDAITIRNRSFGDPVTLDMVIRQAAPLGYRRFFCLFCRSHMA